MLTPKDVGKVIASGCVFCSYSEMMYMTATQVTNKKQDVQAHLERALRLKVLTHIDAEHTAIQ